MSKREAVAEIGAEGYFIVRHTRDVRRAAGLLRAELLRDYDYGCPKAMCDLHRWDGAARRMVLTGAVCLHKWDIGKPKLAWVRILPALPNSYAAAQGWAFTYQPAEPHTRGAFRAVVFS